MHGFDQDMWLIVQRMNAWFWPGYVVCPENECMVLTSVCGCVVNCPESECIVLTSLCVAVWFVQRVNAWFRPLWFVQRVNAWFWPRSVWLYGLFREWMHGFDLSVCDCVVNCPESECVVLTSLCGLSWEWMRGFDQSVAVWFDLRVNAWFWPVCGCVLCPDSECMVFTSLWLCGLSREWMHGFNQSVWFIQRVNAWF